jgi:Holliday junction resolvase RusA-like endonuclease
VTTAIIITVRGAPAPQGSKKFVGLSKAGRGILAESSAKVRPWRQDVKAAAEAVMAGRHALDGPLVAVMTFTLPKPASAPKTRRTWPCRKPDASKLARSTEDALTDAGVWTDDARVIELVSRKVYPGEGADALSTPGAVIRIYSADAAFVNVTVGLVKQAKLGEAATTQSTTTETTTA